MFKVGDFVQIDHDLFVMPKKFGIVISLQSYYSKKDYLYLMYIKECNFTVRAPHLLKLI